MRRVADLWRRAAKDANQVLIHWSDLYRELLASIGALASDTTVADGEMPELLLEVDVQVRFRWIMLGREPQRVRGFNHCPHRLRIFR